MKKAAVIGGLAFLFFAARQFTAQESQAANQAARKQLTFDFNDRLTYRVLLGSPRLAQGKYQIRITAAPEAELKTRPWMATQLEKSDLQGTTWAIEVPAAPPYPVSLENQPRRPISGVMVDLRASYRGEVQIEVSGRQLSFRPQEVQLGRPRDFEDGFVRVEKLPTVTTVAGTTRDEDYPALLSARDESLWLSWIEFDGRADVLRVARWKDDTWTDFGRIAGPGDLYRAEMAEHDDQIWVVWPQQREENWDLYARTYSSDGWSGTSRLTSSLYPDWNHQIASDHSGRLWLAWQGGQSDGEKGNSEVFLRFFENGTWSRPLNISNHSANDWEPALVVEPGKAYIGWDSYRYGNYDVMLARSDGTTISSVRPIAATSKMEVRVDLVRDPQGRIWYSWEEAGPDWGKDSVAFERGLHRERRVRVRCLQGDRIFSPASQPLSAPPPHIGEQSEMAQLAVDSKGRLWLFFRINFLNRIWQQAAIFLEGDRWSEPFVFDPSFGRQGAPLAIARSAKGQLMVGWVSDTRVFDSPFNAVHNDIHLTQISAFGTEVAPTELHPVTIDEPSPSQGWKKNWSDYVLQTKEKRYRLLWGELHRHTDINHHGRPDGALEDAYRYAFDAAQMDFFAATDHITGEPSGSGINAMTWWRSQKYADLHRFHKTFEPLYAYERSKPSPGGHKNLIFAQRGGPLLKGTQGNNVPTDLWADLDRSPFLEVVVIPHQLTGPAINWRYHNPRYEPVMEIYQGRRQSYEYEGAPQPPRVEQIWGKREGSWAWDALANGAKLGFIASSDHGSTHMSYAAVYAEDLSRQSVLEALKAKRTYAASDNIILDFRLELPDGELLMGQTGRASGQPKIRVNAVGTAPIKIIEVIRNNRFVYTTQPNEQEAEFSFLSTEPLVENTYYYVRLIQEDGHMAWSSPIWLEVSK